MIFNVFSQLEPYLLGGSGDVVGIVPGGGQNFHGLLADMDLSNIISKAQEMGDIELAVLLSLMASEHCMISTESGAKNDLIKEVESVCVAFLKLVNSLLIVGYRFVDSSLICRML